jgi:hypothetical protein
MKAKAVLVAVFVAGIAASFAVAAPSHDGGGDNGKGKNRAAATTGTTATTPTTRCRNVELRGTAAPSTFTMTVEKASKRARDVKSATVTFSGPVKVNARMCTATTATPGTTAAATFELRVLKVRKDDDDDDD